MRAVVVQQFGDRKSLKIEDVSTPEPREDEVLIAIKGASINPRDVKNVADKMHGTILPRIPGRDFAGIIAKGPADLLGCEVWGTGGDISRTRDGTHAEFILLPNAAVTLKPASLAMEAAAAAGLSFVTAWEAIVTIAALELGETALIFGATGGVGSAPVQVAKSRGARVIGVVRSDSDIPAVREDGAEEVLNSRSANIADAVRAITKGRGADVSFDASGMMFSEAVEAAALDARIPVVAASPDGTATFNLRSIYRKLLHVHGIDTIRLDAITCAKKLAQLTPGFDSGQFKAKPARPMSLTSAVEAYEQAAHGGGRIILQP